MFSPSRFVTLVIESVLWSTPKTDELRSVPFPAVLADDSSITPDDLRHSATSLTISAGANVRAVQRMLCHAKAPMTFDVYADLFR